jgi:hypothetical protein
MLNCGLNGNFNMSWKGNMHIIQIMLMSKVYICTFISDTLANNTHLDAQ